MNPESSTLICPGTFCQQNVSSFLFYFAAVWCVWRTGGVTYYLCRGAHCHCASMSGSLNHCVSSQTRPKHLAPQPASPYRSPPYSLSGLSSRPISSPRPDGGLNLHHLATCDRPGSGEFGYRSPLPPTGRTPAGEVGYRALSWPGPVPEAVAPPIWGRSSRPDGRGSPEWATERTVPAREPSGRPALA